MSLPSPPRCILNRGHSVHPYVCCFFNLELKKSVHQTLGSISLWSSAYSNHFRTCCARVCFSGWVVWAQMQKKKPKQKPQNLTPQEINKSHQQQEWKHWWKTDMLIYSSSWKESKRMKAPIYLKPLLSWANNVRKKLTPSLLDLLFIFWTSGVPLWFAQSLSCLLTLLVLNKVDPDSPVCSGYYNVASTSAKSEQG